MGLRNLLVNPKAFKWFCIAAIVGVVLLCVGIVLGVGVVAMVRGAVLDTVLVKGNGTESFKSWTNSTITRESTATTFDFYFWNLTNPVAVATAGAKPVFKQVGPYAYDRYSHAVDPVFSSDGNNVTFMKRKRYLWSAARSGTGLTEGDRLTLVNPSYPVIMTQTSGEAGLVVSVQAGVLATIMTGLNGTAFRSAVLAGTTPQVLAGAKAQLIAAMPEAQFHMIWANFTADPAGYPAGLRVSAATPSGISEAAATLIWSSDAANVNVSVVQLGGVTAWFTAAGGDAAAAARIMVATGLSPAQFGLVAGWLATFTSTASAQAVISTFGIGSLDDLCWVQWATGAATAGASVGTAPAFPEYGLWAAAHSGAALTWTEARSLMSGPYSIRTAAGLGAFFVTLAGTPTVAVLTANWGLDSIAKASSVYSYLSADIGTYMAIPTLQAALAQGSGLFATRTVGAWLWGRAANGADFLDPLLKTLGMPDAVARWSGFMTNHSTVEMARAKNATITWMTGADDPSNVQKYLAEKGSTTVPAGTWPEPLKFSGTDGSQFSPLISNPAKFVPESWIDDMMRPVKFTYDAKTEYLEIEVHRYYLARDEVYKVDPKFRNSIDGFFNVSAVMGAPIFYSAPHFSSAPSYASNFSGDITPDPDLAHGKYSAYLKIQPFMGTALQASIPLQMNVYIPDATVYSVFCPAMPKIRLWPMMWIRTGGEAGERLAGVIKDSVLGTMAMGKAGGIALIVVGVVITVAALLLVAINLSKRYLGATTFQRLRQNSSARVAPVQLQQIDVAPAGAQPTN